MSSSSPSDFHARRKFVQTSFGKIAYHEQGTGPAALFVHGVPLNRYQWHGVIDGVDGERRCFAPDLMGFGNTEVAASQDTSLGAQAQMLVAFLDAIGVDRVDLCGNDTGGGVSQIFAAENPHRVRSLTLTNCEVHDLWPNTMAVTFFDSVKSGAFAKGLEMMLQDIEVARKQLAPIFEDAEALTPEEVSMYFAPLVASDQRISLFRGFGDWKRSSDQLIAIAPKQRTSNIPVQVVWGDADTVFDVAPSIDWLRSNLGNFRDVTIVEGGKLFFMTARPEALVAPLLTFWRKID